MGNGIATLVAGLVAIGVAAGAIVRPQPPSHPEAVLRGDAALERGDYAAAVEAYEQALAAGFDRAWVRARLGRAQHALGRFEAAVSNHLAGGGVNNAHDRSTGLYNAACAAARLNDADRALHYLACALDVAEFDNIAADPDFASLSDDPRFCALAEGREPRLADHITFLLGEWTMVTEDGQPFARSSFVRTLEGSDAVTFTKSHNRGGRWAGMLHPESATRTWTWISVDRLGTVQELSGTATETGMVFIGGQRSAAGEGFGIRITFSRDAAGSLLEVGEVSEDGGAVWRHHYRQRYLPIEPANDEP